MAAPSVRNWDGTIKVVGVSRQTLIGASVMNLAGVNQILQERGLVNGAMLKVDPGQAGLVEKQINDMTGV